MILYRSQGGRSDPEFRYRFVVETHIEMWDWCEQYSADGPFQRFYVKIWNKDFDLFEIEDSNVALLFKLKFSEDIIEDRSHYPL